MPTAMFKTIIALLTGIFCFSGAFANDYEDAWTALSKKNFKEAEILLQKAKQHSATALDAYLTQTFLQTYQGNETLINGLIDNISSNPDKSAYLYALWFNGSALGGYGKKTQQHQLNFLNSIIADNTYNGSVKSAAHYVRQLHYLYSNEFEKARKEAAQIGAIQNWQVTGPFENLSGSGFNTEFGPLLSADAATKFIAINNIEVAWFSPSRMNNDGWVFTYAHLPYNTAIIYAQTFVYSAENAKLLLNAGGSGSLKVWVNDALVLSEAKEKITELDYYKNYCSLNKGYNRVVVQLGYTDNSNPNFIIRFTDEKLNAIKDLKSTSQIQQYIKNNAAGKNATSLKHFAEAVFEKKIASDPQNLINYILLSQTYLRNSNFTEARIIIEKALKIAPGNSLLRFELIQCLMKAGNRTMLAQEVGWVKENDKESYINYQWKVQELLEEEKYVEADEALTKMIALYGDDENTIDVKINILAKLEKIDEMLKAIEKAFKQYPENVSFLAMMYRVKSDVEKNPKDALNIYEQFLKKNYNYSIVSNLAQAYENQGLHEKYFKVLNQVYNSFNYDPSFANDISKYYFSNQNYLKALDYANQALALAPYSGSYWYNVGIIQDQMGNKAEAISSYKKTIYYDRTNYDARKKLNIIEGRTDLYKLLPQVDAYELIKNPPAAASYDFSYLLDEKGTIIYDEGASEEYITYMAKLYTEKGIDSWKEIYIPYNSATQTLLVEKCEVVKLNGTKVPAERNEDHVVFTGLAKGDVIYVKYRLQNYKSGRLGKEFWDKFGFNSFYPSNLSRYTLIAPAKFKFNSEVINSSIKPVVKETGDSKVYTWEMKDVVPVKNENLMPLLGDIGIVLHISTLKSWADIANWYSDISYQDNANNFELDAAYEEIFKDGINLTDVEKAKRIYNYILSNIRYSSVSFRQSGFVPQSISKVLSTKLGDCKDLSSLFVALAAKAGLQAQLLLVDTRDNGVRDMVLPSMEFNHCITLVKLNGKDYYLELTDNNLPFASLPHNLNGALILPVPSYGQKSAATAITTLQAVNRMHDKSIKQIDVTVNGKDLKMKVIAKRYGGITSAWRNDYATLTAEQQSETFEKFISDQYKNPVKLEKVSFVGLNQLTDSMITNYNYTVKNEVIEAGSMKMIKIPFLDVIASVENFSADNRQFPIEYWSYENTDVYENNLMIELSPGQKFIEIPENKNYHFKKSTYSIKYIMEGNKLKIYRTARLQRNDILPSEYDAFKKFFTDIVETESKYIVFK